MPFAFVPIFHWCLSPICISQRVYIYVCVCVCARPIRCGWCERTKITAATDENAMKTRKWVHTNLIHLNIHAQTVQIPIHTRRSVRRIFRVLFYCFRFRFLNFPVCFSCGRLVRHRVIGYIVIFQVSVCVCVYGKKKNEVLRFDRNQNLITNQMIVCFVITSKYLLCWRLLSLVDLDFLFLRGSTESIDFLYEFIFKTFFTIFFIWFADKML